MNEYPWKEIVPRLTELLHLYNTPVGMKWIAEENELAAIPRLRTHEKHLPPCVIVSQAVQFNWTVACRYENFHADYCRCINGFSEPDDRWESGKMFDQVWFDNADAAAAHNRSLLRMPAKYVAIVASPLVAERIQPDVCVLYVNASQAFLLLAGYQFKTYEKMEFSFVGESTCSDSWVKTFLTGKPAMALPCFADRKFAGVSEQDLRLTFTPQGLKLAVEGVEGLFRNGLRYPIASYSLTSDILAGLPEHYLKF